jgi:hypothetical protein
MNRTAIFRHGFGARDERFSRDYANRASAG